MERIFSFRTTFQQAIQEISEAVFVGLQGDRTSLERINDFEDCVYLKNEEGTLTLVNESYLKFFTGSESPIGRHAKAFLDPTIVDVSKHTDALILSGSDHLECDHTGAGADHQMYLLRTYKCGLRQLKQPGFAILGITRPLEVIGDEKANPRAVMGQLAQAFRELDDRDREICRLIALGKSSVEIGEQLNMTSRNVDIRRKKGFAALKVEKPIELVRVLVRLQERGYLDLGL
ncbi:Bacterial regulatory protein, luxR family [Planctomycetes bacterium MalM25]|nr:Bacterial regulatory protein, luxR family [Planctomycetes bacterium MalM25]